MFASGRNDPDGFTHIGCSAYNASLPKTIPGEEGELRGNDGVQSAESDRVENRASGLRNVRFSLARIDRFAVII